MRNRALEALIPLVLFACIPVTVRFIAANAYTIGIFRLSVATVAVGIALLWRGQLRPIPGADALRLLIIGFFFFAHWITLFLAIKSSSASVGAIGLSTYGIDLLLLGALFAGERVHWTDAVAVGVAAMGAILVIPSFTFGNDVAVGMALACTSALFYASLPLLHQRWSHIPNLMRTFGQFAFALLFFLLFAGRSEWNLAPRDWAGLLFLAIGVTLVGHSVWVRVTTHLSPRVTSILYYGNIPIAVLLGVGLLGEPVTARMAAGAALIIAGSIFGLAAKKNGAATLAAAAPEESVP